MLFQEPNRKATEVESKPDYPPCQNLPNLETQEPCGEPSVGFVRVKVMKSWSRVYVCARHRAEHNENFMSARTKRR